MENPSLEQFSSKERLIITRDLPIQTRKNINRTSKILSILNVPKSAYNNKKEELLHTEEIYWSEVVNPQVFQNLINAIEEKEIDVVIEEDSIAIEVLPIDSEKLPQTLVHVMERERYKNWINSGNNLGGDKKTNYLQKKSLLVEPDFDLYQPYQPYVRVCIDTVKLLETRKVYIDPESIHETPEEYGKSFIIDGTIPNDCVLRVELCQFQYDNLPGKEYRKYNYAYDSGVIDERKRKLESMIEN